MLRGVPVIQNDGTIDIQTEEEQEKELASFRIENDSQATWAMKKFKQLADKINENIDIANAEECRINEWLKDVNDKLENQANFFRAMLYDYMQRERDKRKSIKLIDGTIKSRAVTRVDVSTDEFVEWAQENDRDDLLIFKEPVPSLAAIKKAENDLPFVRKTEEVSYSIEVYK